jgi:20S proteasome alpha/beta subunit
MYLTKDKPKPNLLKQEIKGMTIGVGFQCNDGVVLGADKQLTCSGYHKYSTNKIYSSNSDSCRFVMSFSGLSDTADVAFRRVRKALHAMKVPPGVLPIETIIETLEQVYSRMTFDEELFQTLIGVWTPFFMPMLFKTSNKKVAEGYSEFIGTGDSSVIHYLDSLLPRDAYSTNEATVLASYFVSIANRYIDGCGGGPDICVMDLNGAISHGSGGVFPNQDARFRHCESEIGREFREILLRGGTSK